jgi:hypothetical protein
MAAPPIPGIYLVSLVHEKLVPVTQDHRYVTTCARVNSSNVKIGKARNLSIRERNYWTDFGQGNIVFVPIASTDQIRQAEAAVLRELASFRKRSPKGARMDWLENIEREAAISRSLLALQREKIVHHSLL